MVTLMTDHERHEHWVALHRLADNGDVAGFYAYYAHYLELEGIVSTHRQILHKMALAVVERSSALIQVCEDD